MLQQQTLEGLYNEELWVDNKIAEIPRPKIGKYQNLLLSLSSTLLYTPSINVLTLLALLRKEKFNRSASG
jgi:hypothetical protein